MTSSAHIDEQLLDFAYGELPANHRATVEEHLETCAQCSEALSRVHGVRGAMSQLHMEEAPSGGLESLLAYAQKASKQNRTSGVRTFGKKEWLFASATVTACLFAGLFFAVQLRSEEKEAREEFALLDRRAAQAEWAAAPTPSAPSSFVKRMPLPAEEKAAEKKTVERRKVRALQPLNEFAGSEPVPFANRADSANEASVRAAQEMKSAVPATSAPPVRAFAQAPPRETNAMGAASSAGAPPAAKAERMRPAPAASRALAAADVETDLQPPEVDLGVLRAQADHASGLTRAQLLEQLCRQEMELNRKDDARKTCGQLRSEFPGTRFAAEAEALLKQLGTQP